MFVATKIILVAAPAKDKILHIISNLVKDALPNLAALIKKQIHSRTLQE